jgi:hypothetical protein
MTRFAHLERIEWPSGDDVPIGGLWIPFSAIIESLGLAVQYGSDDLDSFSTVGFQTSSGRIVQLLTYDAYPDMGTIVFVDSQDDPEAARREVLAILDLDDGAFAWTQ